jgi:hypothetical protein
MTIFVVSVCYCLVAVLAYLAGLRDAAKVLKRRELAAEAQRRRDLSAIAESHAEASRHQAKLDRIRAILDEEDRRSYYG